MEDYGLEEFLRERDARYCAKCKKFTEKETMWAKFLGKVIYCKVCHCVTKNGEVSGSVCLRYATKFKNDFARHLLNDYHTPIEFFSLYDIFAYLRNGKIQLNELPPEVAKEVRDELRREGTDLKSYLETHLDK